MKARLFTVLAAMLLAACQSTLPTVADMDKYFREAEAQAERDVARLQAQLANGNISQEDFDYRAQRIRDSVPQRASKMAWARHELTEAEMRSAGIPTASSPVALNAPGRGATDSFYTPAGQVGGGYQGMGAGMWHGYTPGGTIGTMPMGGGPSGQ